MALELDWTDNTTGVTYNDAYAIISKLTHLRSTGNVHIFTAYINVYKDSTARADGKSPIKTVQYAYNKTISSTDNANNQPNIIREIYNDMKDNDPWDDATDV